MKPWSQVSDTWTPDELSDLEAEAGKKTGAKTTYKFLIGGLWAFVTDGPWIGPPKPPPTYGEIQALAINATFSRDKTLCPHYPVLMFQKSHLLISRARYTCYPYRPTQPSHYEAFIPDTSGKFKEFLVLPLVGRALRMKAVEPPGGITIPHSSNFLSIIDMNHAAIGAQRASRRWKKRAPRPNELVNAKLFMNRGDIEEVQITDEKRKFRSNDGTGSHQQYYGKQVLWALKTKSHLSIQATHQRTGVFDQIVLQSLGKDIPVALSNYCEAANVREHTDADDVRAMYDISRRPRSIQSRLYPENVGNTGSSGDFCPPARLTWL